MVQLIMVFAQLERKMTAERTFSIMRDRVERGLWNGGHILGYRSKEGEPGALEIDEDAAAIVHQIFDGFEELGSAGAITRRLNEQGIRYPSYTTRSGKHRGGNLFAKQKVTGILRNPVYIGQIRWGDAIHQGCHPPIITREQFDRVQIHLGQTVKRRMNLRTKKPQNSRLYLLSGLLRCSCGAHMTGAVAHGRSRKHYYYQCTRQSHEGGKYSCQAPRIPAEALEQAVIRRIRELSNVLEARERIAQRALECLDTESARLREQDDLLRRQHQKTKADIGRLIEVLKNLGVHGIASVQGELGRLEKEERELRRQLQEIAKRQEPMQRISEDAKAFIKTWEDVGELLDAATHEERPLILSHYIEVIELNATDPKGKTGTYAMRLFPEVRPDRGFDWLEDEPPVGPNYGSRCPQNTNGVDAPGGTDSVVLTDTRLVRVIDEKAPRGVLNSNRGFVELGSYAINRLRRSPTVQFYPWNSPIPSQQRRNKAGKPPREPLRLARYYQSLLDTGEFESRAALARFLGVSRARVTQVLNRLRDQSGMLDSKETTSETVEHARVAG
jgi:site-specific DNA recombinase